MRRRRVLLLGWVGVWLLIATSPAWSIVIETGADKRRVAGYVVREDASKLVLRIPTDSGKPKFETYDRANIHIVYRVDGKRLEKLTRDNPKRYRDYADELAGHKDDPEAIDTALRLYLIAAYLDPTTNGPRCLLAMSTLAASPADARKYRALAFLLDAKRDPAVLKGDAPPAKLSETALKAFQQAMRRIPDGRRDRRPRAGNRQGRRRLFSRRPRLDESGRVRPGLHRGHLPAVPVHQPQQHQVCGLQRQRAACLQQSDVHKVQWQGQGKMLRVQRHGRQRRSHRAARRRDGPRRALGAQSPRPGCKRRREAGRRRSWASALSNPQLTPIPVLTLESITDYDPRKCIFRNGAWVAP